MKNKIIRSWSVGVCGVSSKMKELRDKDSAPSVVVILQSSSTKGRASPTAGNKVAIHLSIVVVS